MTSGMINVVFVSFCVIKDIDERKKRTLSRYFVSMVLIAHIICQVHIVIGLNDSVI